MILRPNIDDAKIPELSTRVNACRHLPTYAKLPVTSRIIFAIQGFYCLQVEEPARRGGSTPPVYTTLRGHGSAGRIPKAED